MVCNGMHRSCCAALTACSCCKVHLLACVHDCCSCVQLCADVGMAGGAKFKVCGFGLIWMHWIGSASWIVGLICVCLVRRAVVGMVWWSCCPGCVHVVEAVVPWCCLANQVLLKPSGKHCWLFLLVNGFSRAGCGKSSLLARCKHAQLQRQEHLQRASVVGINMLLHNILIYRSAYGAKRSAGQPVLQNVIM